MSSSSSCPGSIWRSPIIAPAAWQAAVQAHSALSVSSLKLARFVP